MTKPLAIDMLARHIARCMEAGGGNVSGAMGYEEIAFQLPAGILLPGERSPRAFTKGSVRCLVGHEERRRWREKIAKQAAAAAKHK